MKSKRQIEGKLQEFISQYCQKLEVIELYHRLSLFDQSEQMIIEATDLMAKIRLLEWVLKIEEPFIPIVQQRIEKSA